MATIARSRNVWRGEVMMKSSWFSTSRLLFRRNVFSPLIRDRGHVVATEIQIVDVYNSFGSMSPWSIQAVAWEIA